jgi:hypothetical protein
MGICGPRSARPEAEEVAETLGALVPLNVCSLLPRMFINAQLGRPLPVLVAYEGPPTHVWPLAHAARDPATMRDVAVRRA